VEGFEGWKGVAGEDIWARARCSVLGGSWTEMRWRKPPSSEAQRARTTSPERLLTCPWLSPRGLLRASYHSTRTNV
jgi:hypothetical protein